MNYFGPRVAELNEGVDWLWQALYLLLRHPLPFAMAALLAPAGSALLVSLPVWDSLPTTGGWLLAILTVFCYGLPLTMTVSVATGLARAVNKGRSFTLRQLLIPGVLRVLVKCSLFLFGLLLQGYLAAYLIRDLLNPAIMPDVAVERQTSLLNADTILGTQFAMMGVLLLVLQVLFASFVAPLYLFRESPLYHCWEMSFLAFRLNPWLSPALGLMGVLLITMSCFGIFSVLTQMLALPMPIYLGALFYIAWRELFRGEADHRPTAGR